VTHQRQVTESRIEAYIPWVGIIENSTGASGHTKDMEPSDDELWARSRAGDRDAFGLLFERHAKLIYNYCFRRIGNWATTQEMVSTVFLEAWRRRNKDLPSGKVLPWLYGIATNVLRNQSRSERRFAATLSKLPAVEAEPDFGDAADERVDYERQAQDALRLLRALPKREQDVFVLCVAMELSYEDAAFALDVPIGTVRSRLSSARARLRELKSSSGHKQGENATVQEARQP
jgi:RNA polymerase sigma factor (sigma-70 family)